MPHKNPAQFVLRSDTIKLNPHIRAFKMSPNHNHNDNQPPFLEVCIYNPSSGLIAASAGADRLELCAGPDVGGTTPPVQWYNELRANKVTNSIPVNVMIRPRGGDFVYSDEEFEAMKMSIREFCAVRKEGDGFVFGVLKKKQHDDDGDGDGVCVDVVRNRELVKLAGSAPCTFHRAFDALAQEDMKGAIGDLVECGFRRVLTAGGLENVPAGIEVMKEIVETAAEDGIEVIVCGGIRKENVRRVRRETGAGFFHSAAIVDGSESCSFEEVKAMVRHLRDADGLEES